LGNSLNKPEPLYVAASFCLDTQGQLSYSRFTQASSYESSYHNQYSTKGGIVI
jgi:hypothetical protein